MSWELNSLDNTYVDAAPTEVRVGNVVTGSKSFTVTIGWTPPTSGVMYTITTTPVPISPTMPVTITPDTTASRQMDITVNYNTNYTVTVTIQTCDGPREASTTVFRGNTKLNVIIIILLTH